MTQAESGHTDRGQSCPFLLLTSHCPLRSNRRLRLGLLLPPCLPRPLLLPALGPFALFLILVLLCEGDPNPFNLLAAVNQMPLVVGFICIQDGPILHTIPLFQ